MFSLSTLSSGDCAMPDFVYDDSDYGDVLRAIHNELFDGDDQTYSRPKKGDTIKIGLRSRDGRLYNMELFEVDTIPTMVYEKRFSNCDYIRTTMVWRLVSLDDKGDATYRAW